MAYINGRRVVGTMAVSGAGGENRVCFTDAEPTYEGYGNYYFGDADLTIPNAEAGATASEYLKRGDIIYQLEDNTNIIKAIYSVSEIDSQSAKIYVFPIGEIGGGAGASLLMTTTEPTYQSDPPMPPYYTISLSNIYGINDPAVNDYLAYKVDGAITGLYLITNISGNTATLQKIGDVGGSSAASYQHHITLKDTTDLSWVRLTIVNDDDTPFTISTFNQWLTDNGYTSTSNLFRCVSGTILDGSTFYNAVKGIFLSSNQPRAVYYQATNNISGYSFNQIIDDVFPTSDDGGSTPIML